MSVDLALVGGGLANSLIAYRLRATRPELRLALIEQAEAVRTLLPSNSGE